jgi:hypothetical protein
MKTILQVLTLVFHFRIKQFNDSFLDIHPADLSSLTVLTFSNPFSQLFIIGLSAKQNQGEERNKKELCCYKWENRTKMTHVILHSLLLNLPQNAFTCNRPSKSNQKKALNKHM